MRTIDEIALDAALRVKAIDPAALPGGDVQATAAIQVVITEALKEATKGFDLMRQRANLNSSGWDDEIEAHRLSKAKLIGEKVVLKEAGDKLLRAYEELMKGVRYMAVQDYGILNDAPIAWSEALKKTTPELCQDEGCPQHGTDHVCINSLAPGNLTVFTFNTKKSGFAIPNELGVGIIHKPTGIEVRSSSERSQHANRAKALEELKRRFMTTIVTKDSSENPSQD